MYISSADLMTRNMERRVELAAPIYDKELQEKLMEYCHVVFNDNIKGRRMKSNGEYERIPYEENPLSSQDYYIQKAEEREEKSIERREEKRVAEVEEIEAKEIDYREKEEAPAQEQSKAQAVEEKKEAEEPKPQAEPKQEAAAESESQSKAESKAETKSTAIVKSQPKAQPVSLWEKIKSIFR